MNKLIKSLKEYDFAKAEFDSLSPEVFQINPSKLSEADRAIMEGIRYQITVSYIINSIQSIKQSISFYRVSIPEKVFDSGYLSTYPAISLPKIAFTGASLAISVFLLLSLTYYVNVNLNLGLNFITELFA